MAIKDVMCWIPTPTNLVYFLPFPSMHQVESLVDLIKGFSMAYELIHLHLFLHIPLYQLWYTVTTLPTLNKQEIRYTCTIQDTCKNTTMYLYTERA